MPTAIREAMTAVDGERATELWPRGGRESHSAHLEVPVRRDRLDVVDRRREFPKIGSASGTASAHEAGQSARRA
jgi:hypothetical protein